MVTENEKVLLEAIQSTLALRSRWIGIKEEASLQKRISDITVEMMNIASNREVEIANAQIANFLEMGRIEQLATEQISSLKIRDAAKDDLLDKIYKTVDASSGEIYETPVRNRGLSNLMNLS